MCSQKDGAFRPRLSPANGARSPFESFRAQGSLVWNHNTSAFSFGSRTSSRCVCVATLQEGFRFPRQMQQEVEDLVFAVVYRFLVFFLVLFGAIGWVRKGIWNHRFTKGLSVH